jgi:recombination protein RecA
MPAKKTTPSQPSSSSDQNMNDAKKAVLDKALNDIIKRYGEGSIMRLGEAHQMQVEAIPTGALSLDLARALAHSQGTHHRDI